MVSDNGVDHRRLGERILTHSLVETVKKAAISVSLQSKGNKDIPGLTDFEKTVLSKYTYYGFVPAVVSGFATFCCLFGALRFGAYRGSVRARSLPNSATYHERTSQKRHAYMALDGQSAPTRTTLLKSKTETPPKFQIFSDDVVVQVQFLFVSAVAIFVGTGVGNLTMNQTEFHRNLAEVPLQPGKSALCYYMCPLLLDRGNSLSNMQSLAGLYAERDEDSQQLFEEDKEPVLALRPSDMWEDPHTEDLEQLIRLVQNCKLRSEFESECRRRKHRVDPADGLVDVPKPGVPIKFLKEDD